MIYKLRKYFVSKGSKQALLCLISCILIIFSCTSKVQSQTSNTLDNCTQQNCLINPSDAVISSDGLFFIVVDASTSPIIRKFDITESGIKISNAIALDISNPKKLSLKIGLSKNNKKVYVFRKASNGEKSTLKIVDLTNNSVKNITSGTDENNNITAVSFTNEDGSKFLATSSNSKTYNLFTINTNTDTVENTTSLPDEAGSIATTPDFRKVAIAFKNVFTQSIAIYDIESNRLTRFDTPEDIFFKVDDLVIKGDFDIQGNSLISTVSGNHALVYLNTRDNNLTIKILDNKLDGQSLGTISRDGNTGIICGSFLKDPRGFKLYKINLANNSFKIEDSIKVEDGSNVLDIDITPDQNKILVLTSQSGNKTLKVFNLTDLSPIKDIVLSSDTTNSVLVVDPNGDFGISLNPQSEKPINIITNVTEGPIFKTITPNKISQNGGTPFIVEGFINPKIFSFDDTNVCFGNKNFCATNIKVSEDGTQISGLSPETKTTGITDLILTANPAEKPCNLDLNICVSCAFPKCAKDQTLTKGSCCECSRCIYDTSTYKNAVEIVKGTTLSDTTPPEISISTPEDSSLHGTKLVKIEGSVDGTGSSVESITINGTEVKGSKTKKDNVVNFEANIDYKENGTFDIKVDATDKAGNTSEKTVQVKIDIEKPKLSNIESGRDDNGGFTISASADGTGSKVKAIKVDNKKIEFEPSEQVNFSAASIHMPIIVEVEDEAGNKDTFNITVTNESQKPIITIISPTHESASRSTRIIVRGTIDGNGSKVKEIFINDEKIRFSSRKDTTEVAFAHRLTFISDGTYEINVKATNEAGQTSERNIITTIDRVAPLANISAQVNSNNQIEVQGTADGTGSNVVSILINNIPVDFAPDEKVTFSTTTTSTPIRITIIDAAGNRTRQDVEFLEAIPPVITIDSPANLQAFRSKAIRVTGTVDGTGSPVASVTVNNRNAGFNRNSEKVKYSGSAIFQEDGIFDVKVTATDKGGNSADSSIKVIIDSVIPSVIASAEFTNDGQLKISGTANGTGSNVSSILVNSTSAEFTPDSSVDFSVIIPNSSSIFITVTDSAGNRV
ncbi:MAG: hypothetical protein HYR97_06040, partial [Candidatus Melainabacteria bacterium]|nr:hypothetical protein [Candidatus Melainabacteria bacterium]